MYDTGTIGGLATLIVPDLNPDGPLGRRIVAREREISNAWYDLAHAMVQQDELIRELTTPSLMYEGNPFLD